jgi:two-component system, OmpR family, phosphate regulon response regulator PhoB
VRESGVTGGEPSGPRVLIVEDDAEMRRLLTRLLSAEGYAVEAVATSTEALAAPEADLVLIDIVLGDEDGRDLLQELRRFSDVPVVFLTGRGHEMDRIAGLKMGADDYVVKPFSPGELSARVDAVLRRTRPNKGGSTETSVRTGLEFGPLHIDPIAREVELDGELIEMTAKEFDLTLFLASSPRQVFSRQQLLQHVWSSSREWQDEATVTEHIRRVRRKIEADAERPRWIMTVRGVGYRFEPDDGARRGRPGPEPITHSA